MTSDAELIGRSLAGDGQAFMEVIGRHEGAVGAYLVRRAGREAAEDLLGEVWVAAFESRGTYDRSFAGARPWLYGVALNRHAGRDSPPPAAPGPHRAAERAGRGRALDRAQPCEGEPVTVDEMDLVRQLKDAAPLRPGTYEQARTTLRDAMAASGGHARRRTLGIRAKAGIGAGIGVVAAAAAAIALVATPAPRSAGPRPAGAAGAVSQAPTVTSRLASLATLIKASEGSLPGNASLVIRTQTIDGRAPEVSYNLYADSGAFYGGGDKKSLMQAVARHQDDADGIDAREVAAARYAAGGDLAAARVRMVNASPNYLGLGLGPAARKKIWAQAKAKEAEIYKEKGIAFPPDPPTGKTLREEADNYVWNNSVDALSAGAGDPQVREGVLRLLSTISGVTVANSSAGGQRALTLTAGPEVFGGAGSEVLTINARTGMPVKAVMPAEADVPSSVQTFQVSRVTLAGIEAGRF